MKWYNLFWKLATPHKGKWAPVFMIKQSHSRPSLPKRNWSTNWYKLCMNAHGIFTHSVSKLETTQVSALCCIPTKGNGNWNMGISKAPCWTKISIESSAHCIIPVIRSRIGNTKLWSQSAATTSVSGKTGGNVWSLKNSRGGGPREAFWSRGLHFSLNGEGVPQVYT